MWVGSEVQCDIVQVDNVGLDTVSFGLDFELHLGHSVSVLGVLDGGGDVQHLGF